MRGTLELADFTDQLVNEARFGFSFYQLQANG
jgi:hypothetical protein